MTKKRLLSAAFLLLAVALGVFLGARYTARRPPEAEPEPAPAVQETPALPSSRPQPAPKEPSAEPPREEDPLPAEEPPQDGYCLTEHEGHIAVFRAGCDTPEMIFDVPVCILPPADQER